VEYWSKVTELLPDKKIRMARDEGIREPYSIAGIRGIGAAHVFPKTRITRKVKKTVKEEKKPSMKLKEEKKEGIDIEV
jgi:hypothetical protein